MKGIFVLHSRHTQIRELHWNGTPVHVLAEKFNLHFATIFASSPSIGYWQRKEARRRRSADDPRSSPVSNSSNFKWNSSKIQLNLQDHLQILPHFQSVNELFDENWETLGTNISASNQRRSWQKSVSKNEEILQFHTLPGQQQISHRSSSQMRSDGILVVTMDLYWSGLKVSKTHWSWSNQTWGEG